MSPRTRDPVVALLTDFGTREWYVAALKAVVLSRCPRARLIDITHEIPPQDTLAGALVLAAAASWFPPGTVFLAVVDPGVGSRRAILAARANQRWFVGPDNGILMPSLQGASRATMIRVTERRYWLPQISATFQGRDIMAPVAAYLASGRPVGRLGRPAREVVQLSIPSAQRIGRTTRGCVIHADHFGNLITNLPGALVQHARAPVRLRYKGRGVPICTSYAAGRRGQLLGVVGALGFVELAVRDGSAAQRYRGARGDRVELVTGRSPLPRRMRRPHRLTGRKSTRRRGP